MSITILEALQNAEVNLSNALPPPAVQTSTALLGKSYLHNAIVLLEKGYGIDDEVASLLEDHHKVEDVPEKQ